MDDTNTPLNTLKQEVCTLVQERNWSQFHNAKNLSIDIAVEAAELMEFFMWLNPEEIDDVMVKKKEQIHDELADVLIGILEFANHYNIDLSLITYNKIKKIKKNYPIDKAFGNNKKYTEY